MVPQRALVALQTTLTLAISCVVVVGIPAPFAAQTAMRPPSEGADQRPEKVPSPDAAAGSGKRSALALKRAAVAIRKPSPVPPIEAAGTGLTPLVAVRVKVDERGRVAAIEVKGFQPSTAYDAFYERETRRALSEWRFAPAIENGAAVPAVLEWKIRFEPKESRASLPADHVLPQDFWRAIPGVSDDEDARAWARYVASLPVERKRKVLADLKQTADKHLAGDTTTEARKGSFVVVTDASEATAQAIATNLGVATGVLHRLLAGGIPPQAVNDPVHVYVYSAKSSFRALGAEIGAADLAEGFYKPPGLIAIHLERSSSNQLLGCLLHESVHAYLDRIVVKPGVEIPLWINEGLAEYLANSDIKDGKIEPGAHRQRTVTYRNPMVSWRGPSASHVDSAEVKSAISTGRAIPLADLVAAPRNVFYGEKYRLYYTQSWLLVHFLIEGQPTWAVERFPRFLLLIAEGFPAPASFREAYGKDPAAMEEEFRAYVRRF